MHPMILYRSAEGNDLAREIFKRLYGRVVELVDSLDSGSSVHCGRAGSSPASPTKREQASSEACSFSFFDSEINKTGSMAPVCGIAVEPVAVRPAWAKSKG